MKNGFIVNSGHLSRTTRRILERRDKGASGSPFFRRGDRMTPLMKDVEIPLTAFSRIYQREHRRVEEAIPFDLLFLSQAAVRSGYDGLVISPDVSPDPRIPWYGDSNRIRDIGSMLEGQTPRLSCRKSRHMNTEGLGREGRIEAVAPRQIRQGEIDPLLPDPVAEPDNQAPDARV